MSWRVARAGLFPRPCGLPQGPCSLPREELRVQPISVSESLRVRSPDPSAAGFLVNAEAGFLKNEEECEGG